jgi:hypothetical protein
VPRMVPGVALLLSGLLPAVASRASDSPLRLPDTPLLVTSRPYGTWLGQDGHDLVGTSEKAGGNGVQDIHISLAGLPAGQTIASAEIKGQGGDAWQTDPPPGSGRAELVRNALSTRADLYFEPRRLETGRDFEVNLRLDDGQTARFSVRGGAADPALHTRGAALSVRWIGQDQSDSTGPGPAVGPDGFQDVHLVVSRLLPAVEISSVTLEVPGGQTWQYGLNPKGRGNAELVRHRDDPTLADFYFQVSSDLAAKRLKLTVTYASGVSEVAAVVAGRIDVNLAMPRPALPEIAALVPSVRWLGQDGSEVTGRGDVHLAVEGLPAGSAIVAAELSNPAHGSWVFRRSGSDIGSFEADPYALPMIVRQEASATRADLYFPPLRDETDTTLTLRLRFADGQTALAPVAGGACEIALRAPELPAGERTAHPGDDLHALVAEAGTIRLSKGTYRLSRPLILERPIKITSDPDATLLFTQPADDAPWTAAIKIHCGGTLLDGFAVRFSGPVRWSRAANYGPAVIGTTDNLDPGTHNDPKVNLTFTHLDLESPPAASPGTWEEAPRLLRLATATSGRVAANNFKGGTVDFLNGPWVIEQNDHRGTPPWTHTFAVYAGHNTHDLVLRANRARPQGPSGKTWRFLVLTSSGANDLIERNIVEGVGPRDGDTIPNMNAAEIILTEAYSLHFEGKPAAVSADGRIVRIPPPQADRPRSGDAVAILSGPEAGRWRLVAQAFDGNTFLLDRPLRNAGAAISIATGFIQETFRGNTVDSRGGAVAANLVLVGNHYGTRVVGNHFLGGGDACLLTAAPTEQPVHWGWSHAPYLDGLFEGNTIEDALRGGKISVEHTEAIKSSKGRVYMTMQLNNNTTRWTEVFLARRQRLRSTEPLRAWTVGDPGSLDPGELLLHHKGNTLQVPGASRPGGTLRIQAAMVNGQVVRDRAFAVPVAQTVAATAAAPTESEASSPPR